MSYKNICIFSYQNFFYKRFGKSEQKRSFAYKNEFKWRETFAISWQCDQSFSMGNQDVSWTGIAPATITKLNQVVECGLSVSHFSFGLSVEFDGVHI